MIDGVRVRVLKNIVDYRGRLMELFRSDWPEFERFGQLYLTAAKPGMVKGWHFHRLQTDNFLCVFTPVKVALYDSREASPTFCATMEIIAGGDAPQLIQIPPLVYHGFMGIAEPESIVLNVPTQLYQYKEPDEHRVPFDDPAIGYSWGEGARGG